MPEGDEGRLDSWKEIAGYLGREVRTVQLWEKGEGLPIHRHQHARQGSVYAFKSELDVWRNARRSSPPPVAAPPVLKPRPIAWIAAAVLLILAAGVFAFWKYRIATANIPSSIAVLPFVDMSPQKDSEYFADGLSEEIIDALSRVPSLRVVARTSSFAFKGRNVDIREIGKQLDVNAVIEGSVRKSGNNLRITAQLNRVSDGSHLWSRTYDRQLQDVFAIQHEISEAIANELRAARTPARPEPTKNVEAWRLYQEGRFLFNKFEPPDSDLKAIERYKEAIAQDPSFVAAYAGVADAYSYLAENLVIAPDDVMPKAREAAEKALALNESSAEAHTSLGIVKLDYERDVEGGQREFLRALQINPGFSWARHWYAHSLEAQNRMEEALREMQAAKNLDPLSIPINWDIAGELIILGRYDEAKQLLSRAQELFPNEPLFDLMNVVADWREGNVAAARGVVDALRKRPEVAEQPPFLSIFATEDAYDGNQQRARQITAKLDQMRQTMYVDPVPVIVACKALKDEAGMLKWFRRARDEHSPLFVYLRPYAPYWGLESGDFEKLEEAGN